MPVADEIFPKDEIPSKPFTQPPLPIDKFRKIRDDFKSRPLEGQKDLLEWLDDLHKELGSDTVVEEYFKWSREQRSSTPSQLYTPLSVIWDQLSRINWKESSIDLQKFNTTLWHTRRNCTKNLQRLYGKNQDASLWLLVDGQPFAPPEVDINTCEAYSVDVLDPGFVFGMRYIPPDDNDKRDLLFAPLGRIFFSRENDTKSPIDTGLVLLVEILDNGKAGKLVIISDPEDDEGPSPFTGQEALFGKPPLKFTVAKASREIITQSPQDVSVKLEVESFSKPEIVATGSMFRKRGTKSEGALPIALYPRDDARQRRM